VVTAVLPLRAVRTRLHGLAAAVRRQLSPARPVLANLAGIPLTVAGLGCLDAAAFWWSTAAGLAVACPVLIWLEHLIADEP
jgi:hypothetical protein